jgi:hypothetical protein
MVTDLQVLQEGISVEAELSMNVADGCLAGSDHVLGHFKHHVSGPIRMLPRLALGEPSLDVAFLQALAFDQIVGVPYSIF